jgi:DNA polymerase III subunit delta
MRSAMSFSQFQQALRRGSIEPVYLLEGEEEHFHEVGLRLLERASLGGEGSTMNRELVRGDETSLARILDLAATYPMGGGRRMIAVRRADRLSLESADPLKAYLARPNPKSCLVFSDAKFDKRRALHRTLVQGGAARVDCAPLDETQSATWVRERLKEQGFGVSPDLAEAIASGLSGAGLGRLDAELQKLMSAIGAPRPIEVVDLAVLADVPRVEDAFTLAAQVIRGERGEAIAGLRALLRSGEEPVRLLGALSWYFRNALRARVAEGRRLPSRETTRLYGLDPSRLERFRRETAGATAAQLGEALAWCLRVDRELKGQGSRDPAHAFERLIHRVGRRTGAQT